MSQPSVYLAGPLVARSFEDATDWREYVGAQLADAGIKALSPTRGHEGVRKAGGFTATCSEFSDPLLTPRGVMTRDRWDATRCSVLLANLKGAKAPIVGTVMEIAWADLCRIPVVVVADEDSYVANHGMVAEATGYRTADLDEAIEIVKALLL